MGRRAEPGESSLEDGKGDPLGSLRLRPLYREPEDADPVQRCRQPARVLGAARHPPDELIRVNAAPPVLRRRSRTLETTRAPRAGLPRRRPGPPLTEAAVRPSGR